MQLYCIECCKPVEQVEHGTPPTYSDHHYVDLDSICRGLGHLLIGMPTFICARCGERIGDGGPPDG